MEMYGTVVTIHPADAHMASVKKGGKKEVKGLDSICREGSSHRVMRGGDPNQTPPKSHQALSNGSCSPLQLETLCSLPLCLPAPSCSSQPWRSYPPTPNSHIPLFFLRTIYSLSPLKNFHKCFHHYLLPKFIPDLQLNRIVSFTCESLANTQPLF